MFSIPENVKGVIVVGVVRNSPATKAGLQPKDVITALEGKPVKSSVELERSIIFLPPGKTIEITLYRNGQKLSVKVALEERPPPTSPEKSEE